MDWPIPKSATEVRSFLGLVRYLVDFLPTLVEYTGILTELTTNNAEKRFPAWIDYYQIAFYAIKSIIISRGCLTTIDLSKLPEYKFFVMTDARDKRLGAVLSFRKLWSSAHSVVFDLLLVIIQALKKWHMDLLGSPFFIYMDHKTLGNFNTQKDLLCRQAWWMELMSQYDAKIVYIKGDDNSVADSLSWLPCEEATNEAECTAWHPYSYCDDEHPYIACISSNLAHTLWEAATSLADGPEIFSLNATLSILADKHLLQQIRDGCALDPWFKKLPAATPSWPALQLLVVCWGQTDYSMNRFSTRITIPTCTWQPWAFQIQQNVWLPSLSILQAEHASWLGEGLCGIMSRVSKE